MPRVNDAEVRCLISGTKISDLTVYIVPANLMVTKIAAADCGSELTTEELKEIERWLAAHFAAVADPGLAKVSERFENAQDVYSRGGSKNMTGIMSTQFGQTANTLSGGCLAELDKRKASGNAIGGIYSSELT